MAYISFSPAQLSIIEQPLDINIFWEGPCGSGKTTAAVERLNLLLRNGIPGNTILLWVPQRVLAEPYIQGLQSSGVIAGGLVNILTAGGLAKRMIELFWPLASAQAGFAHPDELPIFLTMETAQYYMASLVKPMLEDGYFESVVMDRNRLYSQILDNLNKASLVGFPYTEIGERLKSAWVGDVSQLRVYDDAQYCASAFRNYCLANNLLDFSLQMEIFTKFLWPIPICRTYLKQTYRYLICDNLEEDSPVAHNLLYGWVPDFESVLLIYDHGGGYRRFLGADPGSAYTLKSLCSVVLETNQSFVMSDGMANLDVRLGEALNRKTIEKDTKPQLDWDANILSYEFSHFYPQMLDWVTNQIATLIHDENIAPREIVVLAPFLNDALRFALVERLSTLYVPVYVHRPSRSLKEEAVTRSLLTLATLAHPQWNIHPSAYEFTYALLQIISDLDLVRAQLLVQSVYHGRSDQLSLSSFDLIKPEMQERITFRVGELYEIFRQWMEAYNSSGEDELDHFFSRLFGELLSQPGYTFHVNYYAGEILANMIESIRKFRWIADKILFEKGVPIGKEYLQMVQNGVISALYLRGWQMQTENAVLLAPAYTFLMRNKPVDYQFWLDIGNRSWFECLYQPLTHPYVLSRNWPDGKTWTDRDEIEVSEENLFRLTSGLIHRCRKKIFLGLSEMNEQGYENRGPLLRVINRVLRQAN